MLRIFTTLLALLACLPASASASLALVLISGERIIVASDSRTWSESCDCQAGDVARKVDVRGQFGVFVTGAPVIFESWLRTTPQPGETAKDLMGRILKGLDPDAPPADFAIGIVRFDATQRVDLAITRARVHDDGRVEYSELPDTPVFVPPGAVSLGWDEHDDAAAKDSLLAGLFEGLKANPSESHMIGMAQGFIKTAASKSVKIGGPVHLAVLDRNGSRWLTPALDPDIHWDGTTLSIKSGNFSVDGSAVKVAVVDSGTIFDASRGYIFDTANGVLGVAGADGGGSGRYLLLDAQWTGTPDRNSTVQLRARSTSRTASIAAQAHEAAGTFVRLDGDQFIANFPTSVSAGGIVRYLQITVGGVAYRIPLLAP